MRYLSPKRQNVGGRPVPEATKGVNCKVAEGIEEVLRLIAPGTPIRNGLENILNAKTGALIAVADSDQVMNLVDGGFKLMLILVLLNYMSWQKWMGLLF